MFGRHGKELARAIQRQEYERTPEGVFFPKMGALLFGEFCVTGKYGVRRKRNLLCGGGLAAFSHMVVGNDLNGYIAPFGIDVTPVATWTEFDLGFIAGELGTSPEGYTESARIQWNPVNEGGGVVGNTATPAVFTMNTASTIDVYGYAVCQGTGEKQHSMQTSYYTVADNTSDVDTWGPLTTPYGVIHYTDLVSWWDPAGDAYFDSGLGHWVAVTGGIRYVDIPFPYGTSDQLFSAARMDTAPEVYADGDPLSIVYTVQLS